MCEKRIILQLLFFTIFCFILQSVVGLSGTLKDFTIPILSRAMENRGFVKGESAYYIDAETMEIIKAKANIIMSETKRKWRFMTPQCYFQRENNLIHTASYVQIESEGIYIDGEGMEWRLGDGVLIVHKNVTVDIEKNKLKQVGNHE